MQGCRKEEPIPPADLVDTNALVAPTMDTTNIAPVDTNYVPNTMIETNPPIDTAAPVVTNAGGPAPAATTQGMTEYTIVKGDSFTSIGKKFQVSAKAIADANPGLDPTRLKLGQKINIPAPAPISAAPAVSNGGAAATADGQVVYTVQSGDNLTKIASKYNVSVKAIRSANNLATDRITVGQKLKIPAKAAAQ